MNRKLLTIIPVVTLMVGGLMPVMAFEMPSQDEIDQYKEELKDLKNMRNKVVNYKDPLILDEDGDEVDVDELIEKAKKDFGNLIKGEKFTQTEKKEMIEEWKQMTRVQQCEHVKEKVKNQVNRYGTNYEVHLEKYSGMQAKAEETLEKVDALGVDTTEARAVLDGMDPYLQDFIDAHEDLVTFLKEAEDYSCEGVTDEEKFQEKVKVAKDQATAVREAGKALQDYMTTEVKPVLKDLKEEVKAVLEVAVVDEGDGIEPGFPGEDL